MKILVATDFSKLSHVASEYAAGMAKKLNAELVLLHVVYINKPLRAHAHLNVKEIEDKLADSARQDCFELANELKSQYGAPMVSYDVIQGYPVAEVIIKYATDSEVTFIVIGTKGASGLKKVLLGSTAASVIGRSIIPVIAVPGHAQFNGICKIVYASDTTDINTELSMLVKFARLFGAAIHIAHVQPTASESKVNEKELEADLRRRSDYPLISAELIVSDDVSGGIATCVVDQNADMLALFTRDDGLFEKVFRNSVSRNMAFEALLPMISIKKSTSKIL